MSPSGSPRKHFRKTQILLTGLDACQAGSTQRWLLGHSAPWHCRALGLRRSGRTSDFSNVPVRDADEGGRGSGAVLSPGVPDTCLPGEKILRWVLRALQKKSWAGNKITRQDGKPFPLATGWDSFPRALGDSF